MKELIFLMRLKHPCKVSKNMQVDEFYFNGIFSPPWMFLINILVFSFFCVSVMFIINMVCLFFSSFAGFCQNQCWVQDCCNIQDGAHCDISYRLPAVIYYHRVLHLGCWGSPRSASEKTRTARSVIFSGFPVAAILRVRLCLVAFLNFL